MFARRFLHGVACPQENKTCHGRLSNVASIVSRHLVVGLFDVSTDIWPKPDHYRKVIPVKSHLSKNSWAFSGVSHFDSHANTRFTDVLPLPKPSYRYMPESFILDVAVAVQLLLETSRLLRLLRPSWDEGSYTPSQHRDWSFLLVSPSQCLCGFNQPDESQHM